MSKDPAFLFYSSDFLVDTLAMSFEDRGKLITLLCYMHQNGRMSKDRIQQLAGNLSDSLQEKFKTDDNGLCYSERLEEEIGKRKHLQKQRSENGKLGGRPSKKKDVQQTITDEGDSFEKFWEMYNKPTEKQSCQLKWGKLTKAEQELIFQKLPAYIEATPEKQFRKNPLTYLNRKIWLDEHLPELPKAQQKSAFEMLVETGKYE